MAAARVEFFGVQGIAAGLKDIFALLTKGNRTALPRHQTMRATLDWSHQLLSAKEQVILRRVAAFRGSFTLESAVTLAASPPVTALDAIEGVANLAAQSLLSADVTREIAQYRFLETTRAYASQKLAESGEGPALAQRHAKHCLELIEGAESDWESISKDKWQALYGGRIDDVRAALDWSFLPIGDVAWVSR
jgi:predicted ATPase